jgi:pilus assembly protein CpaC
LVWTVGSAARAQEPLPRLDLLPVAQIPPPPTPQPGTAVQPVPVEKRPAEGQPPVRPFDPFGPGRTRLPRLGDPAPVGTTPQPTAEMQAEYKRYVRRVVDPENTLDLVVGRSRLLVLTQPPLRTQMVDDRIAFAEQFTPTELTITGREVGSTILNLWFPDPKEPKDESKQRILSYLVRVIPDPEARQRLERVYKALEDEINRAFPDSLVHLFLVGDKLVVTGQAKDIAEGGQILRIVRSNAPGEASQVPVDRIDVSVTPGADLPAQGLQNFLLSGGPNVINLLRIPGEQQVMLKVVVAEINRAAARSIGVNFAVRNQNNQVVFAQLTGNLPPPGAGGGTGGATGQTTTTNIPLLLDGGQVAVAINALRTLNYARSLAEPNLVTLNGQTASFQAGGQFPVPQVTGFTASGLQGVAFVPFGVQLSFTPYITDKDRIRLTLSGEVSSRDLQAAQTNINGANITSLTTRNFQTTVELREGQTLAIAGLIQNNIGADATRIPFFGDLPIVGHFFGFDRTSAGEQELVVLITPELVHPLDPHETPALPGSDVFEPGDLEFYLHGRLESRRLADYRSPVRTDFHRMVRYRHCEDIYIAGPQGHSDGHP